MAGLAAARRMRRRIVVVNFMMTARRVFLVLSEYREVEVKPIVDALSY